MYFNKDALLTVLNHRIEKYQEQLKSIRKNFNKENNQEKIVQLLVIINMLEARINELSTIRRLIDDKYFEN